MIEKEQNRNFYAILPSTVRYDVRLKDKAKLLYAEITCLTNEKGYCWATNNYFAELYNTSKGNISKLLSQLKDCGYIHIELIRNKETKQVEKRLITLLSNLTIGMVKNDDINLLSNSTIGMVKNEDTPIVKNDAKEYYKYSNNIIEYYNGKNCFSKIIKLTKTRKDKIEKRVKEIGYDKFIKAIDIASQSNFLTGQNNKNWKMDLDWLIANDTNILKVLEGKYSNKEDTNNYNYGPEL